MSIRSSCSISSVGQSDDYAAGFPEHLHRGFETVTYMIDGAMQHQDSVGGSGPSRPRERAVDDGRGTASCTPRCPKAGARAHVGIPALGEPPARAEDDQAARYRISPPGRIPGSTVTDRISGSSRAPRSRPPVGLRHRRRSAVPRRRARQGRALRGAHPVGPSFVCVRHRRRGAGSAPTIARSALVSSPCSAPGDRVVATCDANSGRMVLLAGRPINEPVGARRAVRHANTQDEIRQAWDDYRSGKPVTPSG